MAGVVYLHPFGDRASEGFVGPYMGHFSWPAGSGLEPSVSVACAIGPHP